MVVSAVDRPARAGLGFRGSACRSLRFHGNILASVTITVNTGSVVVGRLLGGANSNGSVTITGSTVTESGVGSLKVTNLAVSAAGAVTLRSGITSSRSGIFQTCGCCSS